MNDNDIYYWKATTDSVQNKYRNKLVYLEYASIVITLTSFIIYIVLAYEDESVSAFAFATDSFLDVLAYIVVIWRFAKKGDLHSDTKDRKALILLGVFFFISSIVVEYESIHNLVFKIKPLPSVTFIIIGFIECIIFSMLTIFKFVIAKKMDNNSTVISDALNSLIAAFGGLTMSIGMLIFMADETIWYLDAIFGFVMGAFVFVYGCRLLIQNICLYKA